MYKLNLCGTIRIQNLVVYSFFFSFFIMRPQSQLSATRRFRISYRVQIANL